MARITRKELKTDKFALEVEHTVTFFEEHRTEILRYGGIAVAVVLVIAAFIFYNRKQHTAREQELAQAIRVQEAPVGPPNPGAQLSFPTQEAKDKEAVRVFTGVATKYSGTAEGWIGEYYLGAISADQGKLADAEKRFQKVAQSGDKNYASLAKLSLAEIYFAEGRNDQAAQLLRSLMDQPTVFVSKEQATVVLARGLAKTKPVEARKLLEPLRTSRDSNVSQLAIQTYAEISQ